MANEKENAKLAKEAYDLFSKGDLSGTVQHFAENAKFISMPTGETLRGRNEIQGFIGNFKTAFPDMKLDVNRQVSCGDQVVTEFAAKGTHKGIFKTPMGDISPTNRKVEMSLCEVLNINADGKFTEAHLYFDTGSLMQQLGIMNLSEAQNSM
jgi:steroid delta-isomerase-like uncharacterized protein